jgi:DNA-binding response OmpR family regulator
MARLRRKIEPEPGRAVLETVRGVGYRLNRLSPTSG